MRARGGADGGPWRSAPARRHLRCRLSPLHCGRAQRRIGELGMTRREMPVCGWMGVIARAPRGLKVTLLVLAAQG